MNSLPKNAKRDPKSGALVFKKTAKGTTVDLRIIRKILLDFYRVMPEESKSKLKPEVKKMIELL